MEVNRNDEEFPNLDLLLNMMQEQANATDMEANPIDDSTSEVGDNDQDMAALEPDRSSNGEIDQQDGNAEGKL